MNGTVTMSHAEHHVFSKTKEEVIQHCKDIESVNEGPFVYCFNVQETEPDDFKIGILKEGKMEFFSLGKVVGDYLDSED